MELINLNSISEQFAEQYYLNDKEDIINDILRISNEFINNNIDSYNTIKMIKAIISYCAINNIDLNKFFKLKI